MKRTFYILSALLGGLIAGLLASSPVRAIDSYGVGAVPAYPNKENPRAASIFIYQLSPGKSVSDGVRVVNNSDEQKTIAIYPVDSEVSSDGAFACKQEVESRNSVGSWIQLAKSEVTLAPHSDEIIPLTLTVPIDMDIGEYNGCIAVQDMRKNEASGNGIVLSFRSALRVAVMVPGQIRAGLIVKEFSVKMDKSEATGASKVIASPLLHNNGNVSVDAQLDVSMKNMFGMEVEKGGGKFPILRDVSSRFNIELKTPFWGGWYTVSGSVAYRPLQTTKQEASLSKPQELPTQTIFVMPDPKALAIEIGVLLALVAAAGFGVWRMAQARLLRLRAYEYEVVEGDDIETLAGKNKTTWKVIAQLNHLKPPYHLTPGSIIKIPGKKKPIRSKRKKASKE